jgi:hypothetical protein
MVLPAAAVSPPAKGRGKPGVTKAAPMHTRLRACNPAAALARCRALPCQDMHGFWLDLFSKNLAHVYVYLYNLILHFHFLYLTLTTQSSFWTSIFFFPDFIQNSLQWFSILC